MGSLTTFFAHHLMLACTQEEFIGVPEVAVRTALPIFSGNALPEFTTTLRTTITNDKGHNLACSPTQRYPEPTFLTFVPDKRPQFIQFQHFIALRGQERLAKGG